MSRHLRRAVNSSRVVELNEHGREMALLNAARDVMALRYAIRAESDMARDALNDLNDAVNEYKDPQ